MAIVLLFFVLCTSIIPVAASSERLIPPNATNCYKNKCFCTETKAVCKDMSFIPKLAAGINDFTLLSSSSQVRLQHINDTDFFSNVSSVSSLTVSAWVLSFSPGVFDVLENLTSLNLTQNHLKTVSPGIFDDVPKLKSLDISHNNLSGSLVPGVFNSLKDLRILKIDGNSLSALAFGVFNDLRNITSLDVSHNALETVDPGVFQGLENLKNLNISHNALIVLNPGTFSSLVSLMILDISYNALNGTLRLGVFDGLRSLRTLIISHNSLDSLEPGLFDSLENLKTLNMSDNAFQSLPSDTFGYSTRSRLEHVNLRQPWSPPPACCGFVWLAEWILSQPSVFDYNVSDTNYDSYMLCWIYSPNIFNDHWEVNLMTKEVIGLLYVGVNKQLCLLDRIGAIVVNAVCFVALSVFTLFVFVRWKINQRRFAKTHTGFIRRVRDALPQRVRYLIRERARFKYDVFVSFAEEDQDLVMNHLVPFLEGQHGLRLCLHQRDFHPGRNVLDNIQESAEDSCRQMVVFSSHFAASPWCQFELSLCQRLTMEREEDLVIVFVEAAPDHNVEMTASMDAVVKTHTYIPWPNQPNGRRLEDFWGFLNVALQDVIVLAKRRRQQQQQQRCRGRRGQQAFMLDQQRDEQPRPQQENPQQDEVELEEIL